jgi:hypothetical protein
LEKVVASLVANAAAGSTFLLVVIVLGWCAWACLKRRRSRTMRAESETLLKDANDAIHSFLNPAASTPPDQVQQGFEKWEFDMTDKLERLRRRGLCTAWQVDHFRVLNKFEPVDGAGQKGMVSEKAQRLKRIARQLELQAARLWPL